MTDSNLIQTDIMDLLNISNDPSIFVDHIEIIDDIKYIHIFRRPNPNFWLMYPVSVHTFERIATLGNNHL